MSLVFLVAGGALLVASAVVFAYSRRVSTMRWRGTVLLAAGLLGAVTGWLLTEPNANRGEADQVRVGALHALAGLGRVEKRYVQTVLEILCSYLRRPFDYLSGDEHEKVVRTTAQRLIRDLLPLAADPKADAYHLDLTGAQLAYFDISERVVGTLTMRFTTLHESNSLWGCRITGSAWFTGASSPGILHAHDTAFGGRTWFSGFTATGPVRLARSTFAGPVKTTGAKVAECDVDLHELDTVG